MVHLYIIIIEYLASCIGLLIIILEVFLALHRLFLVSRVKPFLTKRWVWPVATAIVIPAMVVHTPVLFVNELVSREVITGNETVADVQLVYMISRTKFGQSALAKSYHTGLSLAKIALVTIGLLMINIVTVIKYKAYISNKLKRQNGILHFQFNLINNFFTKKIFYI
jgi:hypothetical protein